MSSYRIKTYAKINTSLLVFSPNKNKYHPLCSIFQSIGIYDEIIIHSTTKKEYTLSCSDPTIPTDDKNLIMKLINQFKDHIPLGLTITLIKNIPQGAGLGGGSSNAAGILIWLNTTFKWDLSETQLIKIATRLGADIPFCLNGGTACVRGIGEKIKPIQFDQQYTYIVIFPHIHVETKKIFTAFDQNIKNIQKPKKTTREFLKHKFGQNQLKPITFSCFPKLQRIENIVQSCDHTLYMSGSGSTCFIPFKEKDNAEKLVHHLRKKLKTCTCIVTQDYPRGNEITCVEQ